VLAIVTCGPQLEVALRRAPGRVPSLIRLAGLSARSRLLMAAVDLLMEDAELEPTDVDRVLVTRGPGSFTGIRSGLAAAAGLAAALDVETVAYDSLTTQAARCLEPGIVWAAQPGRRGEIYGRAFRVAGDREPEPIGDIEILAVDAIADRRPWIAPEALDLTSASRVTAVRSAPEALLALAELGTPAQPMDPLYVEEPPVHGGVADG